MSGIYVASSEDKDGAADDEPGPSPLSLLLESAGWHALDGAQTMVCRAYEAAADRLGAEIAGREVTILLSSDEAVAALNARYRGKEGPTNVLSFPATAVPGAALPPLGDIIIAHETLMREAADEGKPPLFHLAHLTVHGLLHLAGFDHETDGEAERMEALEREILASIRVPDPYSSPTDETPAAAG